MDMQKINTDILMLTSYLSEIFFAKIKRILINTCMYLKLISFLSGFNYNIKSKIMKTISIQKEKDKTAK